MTRYMRLKELLELLPEIEKTDIILDDDAEYEVFDDIEEYAEYELFDGWYGFDDSIRIKNGAPNPLYFVDLKKFGEELAETWDFSNNALLNNGEVIRMI